MIRDHQESHTRDLRQSFCVHFSQDESYLPILSLEGPEGDSPTVLSPWVRYSQTKCNFDVITSCWIQVGLDQSIFGKNWSLAETNEVWQRSASLDT